MLVKKLAFILVLLFLIGLHFTVVAQSTPTPSPDPLMELLLSATNHLMSGEYDTALEEYNQVLEIDPENYVAYYGVGDIQYHVLQDCEKAVEAYQSALDFEPPTTLAFDPAAPLAYGKIADCMAQVGEYENAVEALNHVAELKDVSSDAQFFFARGQYYLELDDQAAAAADYSEVLKLDPPGFASYLYSTANEISRAGTAEDLNSALFHFNILISGLDDELFIDSPDLTEGVISTLLNRGIVFEQLGDLQAAAADYFAFIELARPEQVDDEIVLPTSTFTVEMQEGMAYYLSFEGEMGAVISITALGSPVGEIDPLILLLNSDGTPLIGNDDLADDNFNARIADFELPADGTYTLVVSHAGGGSEGRIRLQAQIESE